MSRRVVHVLASVLLISQTVSPVLAADSSQVNFKIFSPPGSQQAAEDSAAEPVKTPEAPAAAASPESMWTEGDASTQAPPGASAPATTDASSSSSSAPADASVSSSAATESSSSTSSASAESSSTATSSSDSTASTAATPAADADGKVLQGYIRIVPSGTKVPIIMDSAVDSDTSQEGDEFAARTSEDLTIDGSTVVPAGSVIKGRIARLNAPKALNRSGSVALKFDTVTTPDNRQIPLTATLVARGGVVHAKRGLKDIAIDTGTFVAPTGIGAVIGAIAGGASNSSSSIGAAGGLLIGVGIGAAIGTIILCAKKGKRVDVRPGDELKIELAEDLRMPM
ncbi:MAG: TrbI/VirB10 family protein [Candidatus Obscuribacterales bacterium]|nr:TrbI/VirB10 family protein [Candidatus Obscuribacterales bacterium]